LPVLAGTVLVALLQARKAFYYDSGVYWSLNQSFIKGGHFSLLNFNSPLRGYLLPLINRGLHEIAVALEWRGSTVVKLFNALMFSLIAAVLAPRLAELAWPAQRWCIPRRIALAALLLLFWSGFLAFPLSDFPALTMAMLALVSTYRYDAPGWMILGGLACGAAIDMRPSYLLLAPILLVLIAWRWTEGHREEHASLPRRSLCVGIFIAGLLVVSLPQSLSSHRHHHTWSFIPGAADHLTSAQLSDGLFLQRYDTYVGPGHPPQMNYLDEAGYLLLIKQKNHLVSSASQYLGLLFSHPGTVLDSLGYHIVNGLDQRYTTPYIERVDTGGHRWLRLAGFLLVFLALVRVLWPAARRRLGPARWRYPVALMLCCLTSVPSAVETRYMLPVYVLGYILVLAPGWPNPLGPAAEGIRRYRVLALLGVGYLLFMALVWHIASDASKHLIFGA
jgi:hypothetical protein